MLAFKGYDYLWLLLLKHPNSVINIFTERVVFIYILFIAHNHEW